MTKMEAAIALLAQYPEKRREEILAAACLEAIRRNPAGAKDYEEILEILRSDS